MLQHLSPKPPCLDYPSDGCKQVVAGSAQEKLWLIAVVLTAQSHACLPVPACLPACLLSLLSLVLHVQAATLLLM